MSLDLDALNREAERLKLRRAVLLAAEAEVEEARGGDRLDKHAADMRARAILDYLSNPKLTPPNLREKIAKYCK